VSEAPAGISVDARAVGRGGGAGLGTGVAPWLFLAPFLVLFAVFTAYPLGRAVPLAFEQTYGPGASRFVGLENFRALFADPLFWRALWNTVVYVLTSVFIQLPLSLLCAMLLNRPGLRGRAVYRLVFFSPALVGVVFVAMIFGVIFEKRTGLLNQALHAAVGWSLDFPWLQAYVMPSLVIATLWQYMGFNMIYFLAALQNVPRDLVEAAELDGAGPVRRFLAVTWPAVRPVATFVVLLSVIGSFQLFELPYVLLNASAGPDNRGLTVVMYLYQRGFEAGDLGYASAIGWVLAVVLVGCAALQRRLARGEVGS
jgi:ABC-type sugar transport system permease subunit